MGDGFADEVGGLAAGGRGMLSGATRGRLRRLPGHGGGAHGLRMCDPIDGKSYRRRRMTRHVRTGASGDGDAPARTQLSTRRSPAHAGRPIFEEVFDLQGEMRNFAWPDRLRRRLAPGTRRMAFDLIRRGEADLSC